MNLKEAGLETTDPFVYASIKRYANKDTNIAFPSMTTLVRVTGVSKPTITKAVERLEKAQYLKIIREFGKSNKYQFNEYNKFECFSYDFLDMPELSALEKAYLVIAQPHMLEKDAATQTGKVHYDQESFAKILNVSLPTLRKIERHLQELGILHFEPTNQKELVLANNRLIPSTGLNLYNRVYSFPAFCNEVALAIQQHQEQLVEHGADIELLKADSIRKDQEIISLRAEVEELKKAINKQTPIIL